VVRSQRSCRHRRAGMRCHSLEFFVRPLFLDRFRRGDTERQSVSVYAVPVVLLSSSPSLMSPGSFLSTSTSFSPSVPNVFFPSPFHGTPAHCALLHTPHTLATPQNRVVAKSEGKTAWLSARL
jgi:hypothetical protein